jgi:hypothetical protein
MYTVPVLIVCTQIKYRKFTELSTNTETAFHAVCIRYFVHK